VGRSDTIRVNYSRGVGSRERDGKNWIFEGGEGGVLRHNLTWGEWIHVGDAG